MLNRYLLKIGFLFIGLWSIAMQSSGVNSRLHKGTNPCINIPDFASHTEAASGSDLLLDVIITPGNKDEFVYNTSDSMQLAVQVSAAANSTQFNIPIHLIIKDANDSVVLRDTQYFSILSDSTKLVYFNKFSLNRVGEYTVSATVFPSADDISSNNMKTRTFSILVDVDMAITTIFQPANNDSFEVNMTGFYPVIRVISLGRLPVVDFPVVAQLLYQGEVLQEKREYVNLTYQQSDIVVFDSFIPSEYGSLQLRFFADIPYDYFRLNDTIQKDVYVKNSNDIKLSNTANPINQARLVPGIKFNPTVTITNLGINKQDSVYVVTTIRNDKSTIYYFDSILTSIGQFSSKNVSFKEFNGTDLGEYTICSYVRMRTDQYPRNDTLCTRFYISERYNLKLNTSYWPLSNHYYVPSDVTVLPAIELHNTGRDSAIQAPISVRISNESGAVLYRDTLIANLGVGEIRKATFTKPFVSNVLGKYELEYTNLWTLESTRTSSDTLLISFEIRPAVELRLVDVLTPKAGDTLELTTEVNGKVTIQNIGVNSVADLSVYIALMNDAGDTLYDDTLNYYNLAVNEYINLQSSEFWPVFEVGDYTLSATILTPDSFIADNTVLSHFIVVKTNDGAVVSLNAPGGSVQWKTGVKYAPKAVFKNEGLYDFKFATVSCKIWGDNLLYSNVQGIEAASGELITLSFDSFSFVKIQDSLRVVFSISTFDDLYTDNDSLEFYFNVTKGVNSTLEVLAKSVLIYPNPFSNDVYIRSDVRFDFVEIYSSTGVLLALDSYEIVGNRLVLNGKQGVYFLHLYTDKGVIVKTIVKTE